MAFSLSQDRGIQSVSVGHPLSTPPTSPSAYISSIAEDTVVDADGIERWLTSPARAGSTDDLANNASNCEGSTRLRLADVTARRRRQQMQQQNQPSPRSSHPERQKNTQETLITYQQTSLRHSNLVKECQVKEQKSFPLRDTVPPNINSSQKREQFRQTAAMTIAAVEKGSRGYSHKAKSASTTVSKDSEVTKNLILSDDNDLLQRNDQGKVNNERLDATALKRRVASPGIAAIRRRRQQRLHRREFETELNELEEEDKQGQCISSSKTTTAIGGPEERVDDSDVVQPSLPSRSFEPSPNTSVNVVPNSQQTNAIENEGDFKCDDDNHNNAVSIDSDKMNEGRRNSDGKDGRVFSVSRTKKIHLLKRHDACRGGSPLVREVDIDPTRPSQNDATQITILSDENSISTISRLRMIRRQMADGNHRSTREHQHELEYAPEQRSLLAADDLLVTGPEAPSRQPSDEENKTDNATNMIKDALARSRSYRRSISKRNVDHGEVGNDVGKCGETYGERALKNHFQSSSIPCSSVISTGTSTISVGSDGSSFGSNCRQTRKDGNAVDDDDEVTSTTSVSETTSDGDETDEDGVSQLSVPQESKASAVELTGSLSNVPSPRYTDSSLAVEEETPTSVNQGKNNDLISSADEKAVGNSSNERIFDQNSLDSSFDLGSIEKLATAIAPFSAVSKKQSESERQALQVRESTSRIKLHVYDLVADDTQLDLWGCHFPLGQVFNAFNSSLHSIGTGAYHVGLEISGIEYAYGANSTKGLTGIFTCEPRCSPGYQFRTTIDFGKRVVKQKSRRARNRKDKAVEGQEIVRGMANEYLGTDYDLLRKNCCTFAHDVCIRLGINEEEIPSWFHNLAAAGAITQDAANYTLAPITQLFGGDELDKFNEYINNTALNDRLEAIQDGRPEERKDHEFVADTAYQF